MSHQISSGMLDSLLEIGRTVENASFLHFADRNLVLMEKYCLDFASYFSALHYHIMGAKMRTAIRGQQKRFRKCDATFRFLQLSSGRFFSSFWDPVQRAAIVF